MYLWRTKGEAHASHFAHSCTIFHKLNAIATNTYEKCPQNFGGKLNNT
jgi:hypothetical protein